MDEALAVYVPNSEAGPSNAATIAHIDRGSGIVSRAAALTAAHVEIYYEGNRYGYANVITYGDRCYHAADRLRQKYPTVAYSLADRVALLHVGWFHFGHGVRLNDHHVEVANWLGLWENGRFDSDRLAAELLVTESRVA